MLFNEMRQNLFYVKPNLLKYLCLLHEKKKHCLVLSMLPKILFKLI
jgi:hypothetical protein